MPEETPPETTEEAEGAEEVFGRKLLDELIEIRTDEERVGWIGDNCRTMGELNAILKCIQKIRINQLLSNILEKNRQKYGIIDPDALEKDSVGNYPPIICNQIYKNVAYAMILKETSDQLPTPTQ